MPIASLINRRCTLRHRSGGTVNDDGDRVPSWTTTDTVCEVQQRRRSEDDDQIDTAVWVAFFLPGEVVGSGDILEVDGVSYELVGDPWHARNPLAQRPSHIEATLQRTAGAEDAT